MDKKSKAILMLENGFCQEGFSCGAEGETVAEIVFNTAMTGYQEILTDPSYKGQAVVMTYPLIGNYGINDADCESDKVQAEGLIIKEKAAVYSNWQAEGSLEQYLRDNNIVAIEGVDTRAITRILRDKGAMKGIISTKDFDERSLQTKIKQAPSIDGVDLASKVTTGKTYEWKEAEDDNPTHKSDYTIAVIDCGVKRSILKNLKNYFNKIVVMPANSTLEEILASKPDGIMFSNGPGDPSAVTNVIALAGECIEKTKTGELKVAIMGICLGHQILGIALGSKTYKLKFGHHGGNHPVRDIRQNRIDITSQNHNYCVDMEMFSEEEIELTHLNLYDKTPEGMRHRKMPIYSVQFHPEAGPGPFDAKYIFFEFKKLIDEIKNSC